MRAYIVVLLSLVVIVAGLSGCVGEEEEEKTESFTFTTTYAITTQDSYVVIVNGSNNNIKFEDISINVWTCEMYLLHRYNESSITEKCGMIEHLYQCGIGQYGTVVYGYDMNKDGYVSNGDAFQFPSTIMDRGDPVFIMYGNSTFRSGTI